MQVRHWAFLSQMSLAGAGLPSERQHCLRAFSTAISFIAFSAGCATVDFVEEPKLKTSLEEVLASEDSSSECLELGSRSVRADGMQRAIWQERVADHLKECGGSVTLRYLRSLVALPTVPGNTEAREQAKSLLMELADKFALSFTSIGEDDIWLLELGDGPLLADFITLMDVHPGPPRITLSPTKTVYAHKVTTELDRLYGRGVEDNKTAIASVLTLFESIHPHLDSFNHRLRLIVVNGAKSDLSVITSFVEAHELAPSPFLLQSKFPVVGEVFGSEDLMFRFRRDDNARPSNAVWQLETLGGGHSPNATPNEALMVLRYRGNNQQGFQDELASLTQWSEESLKAFSDQLALDIRPIIDELKVVLSVRGQASSYASPTPGGNPLVYLGHLNTKLDLSVDYGRSVLEFLAGPQFKDSLPETEGPETMSALVPVMLRLEPEAALLRLRRAHKPSHEKAQALHQAEDLLRDVQTTIWSLSEWEHPPQFEAGYALKPSWLPLEIAAKTFAKHFSSDKTNATVDREGTLARRIPNAIGFGPLLPGHSNTSLSYSESLHRSVADRWARMLFEIVDELANAEN